MSNGKFLIQWYLRAVLGSHPRTSRKGRQPQFDAPHNKLRIMRARLLLRISG